jgi:hypothetical protein
MMSMLKVKFRGGYERLALSHSHPKNGTIRKLAVRGLTLYNWTTLCGHAGSEFYHVSIRLSTVAARISGQVTH